MATPSLAMIPSGYKASKVYSVLPESGVGDFDFTRATTATRINSSGLIEEMAINVPRLEYPLIDGVVNGCPSLILEPQRLQKIQYSEDFNQSYWTKSEVSVNPNNVISPNGTLNADAIIESTTSNAYHRVLPASPFSGIGGTNYSFSVYVKKKGDTRHIYWMCQRGADAIYAHFDMTNYVINDSNYSGSGNLVDASITPVGNDWYRISISGIVSSVSADYYTQIYLNNQLNSGFNPSPYTGDGTSGLYLWGWQVEQGSFPTSYIPNYGTALGVTRNAETCTGAGDAATFNSSEGVLMAEISALTETTDIRVVSISDGTTSNMVFIRFDTLNRIIAEVTVLNGGSVNPSFIAPDITSFNKIALKWALNDVSLWVNGIEVDTISVIGQFAPNTLNVMNLSMPDLTKTMDAKTKQLQYYNSALTDSELEKLTSWTSFSDMANGQQYSII